MKKKTGIWMALAMAVGMASVATAREDQQPSTGLTVTGENVIHVGVDYYPEHWPRERWAEDIDLMKKAGFTVVRMAEFDWGNLEPAEGVYDFSMWDEVLDLLHANGIRVLMCTPTASMPAWLARRYPEVMATGQDGQRKVYGIRRENCFSSTKYHERANAVTAAMAEHYKDHPAIIGWQLDNELGYPACFCDLCRNSFQNWLRDKYKKPETLNAAWGNSFWSQPIRQWDDVFVPGNYARNNPSTILDWRRHYSWLNFNFVREQTDILRRANPDWYITSNFMELGWHELNQFDIAEPLDFVSWDNYPTKSDDQRPYKASMGADLMRGFKKRNFWVTEQTAGTCGTAIMNRNTRSGEIRAMTFQQFAHGCDGFLWFRWRTCTSGREQYWHGLLGHDGRALRRYDEAAQTARELEKLAPMLVGTTVHSDIAFIYDYDSDIATRFQSSFLNNWYVDSHRRWYDALFRAGISADFVKPTDPLDGYRIVFAPNYHVLPDDAARRLDDYVKQGGILVTDCRTAVKNETNLCHPRTLPGLLSSVLGIEIQEYEGLETVKYPLIMSDAAEGTFTAFGYIDWIIPRGAEVLARFGEDYLADFAAVTRNPYGKGVGYYSGAIASEPAFYDTMVARILADAKMEPSLPRPPEGVQLTVRENEQHRILFVINHTFETKTVKLPPVRRNLLDDSGPVESVELPSFGVAVYEL